MSNFATIFLLFDVAGLLAVILLFILYFNKSRKLKKMLKKNNPEEGKGSGVVDDDDNDDDNYLEEETKNMNSIELQSKEEAVREEKGGGLIFMEEEEAASFELDDLLKASAEGLGKGIFGNSYKAMMEGRSAIVVKRLRDLKPLSYEEFRKQLSVISEMKHPNLLPLVAYYYSKEEKLLLYKFAEKGNLFNRIHGESMSCFLLF